MLTFATASPWGQPGTDKVDGLFFPDLHNQYCVLGLE